ncbi:plasmid mobilization protein [Dorea formicigenerans]|uniref:plasmid mobilization protein n=1 Tax=Dorea formicigenerans TaxID=39486 RepID=UPI0015F347AC|nr:hypothetical protein [Dorea formicigenerans]
MKEYSKGIYVKFKPEEVEILHNRMKEAGVQNMSAYIRKMALKTNNNNTNFNNIYLILSGSEETSLWIGYDGFQ